MFYRFERSKKMKKKSIMGLEFKWEVFLVYLLSILGFVFSFMKDKKVDEDVKLQYNQSGTIFIINMVIYIATSLLKNVLSMTPYCSIKSATCLKV